MTLKPCRVCGTLNSSEADTCLSCGHDPNGYKRPVIFRIAAILAVLGLIAPLLFGLLSWLNYRFYPQPEPLLPISEPAALLQTANW